MKRWVAFLLGACAGLSVAQPKSDHELEAEQRSWKEGEYKLPAPPKTEDLIEFYVSAGTDFRFFIDQKSLSVGKDGVIRFTLLARSTSGAETVSYEGIRCSQASYRVYAFGRQGAGWTERESDWRPIEPKTTQRWRNALLREYFCPMRAPIFDPQEGIDALRRGGHPNAVGLGLQPGPGGRY